MGKHDQQPRTGDGRTGGNKPKRLQVTVKTETGTTLWGQTTGLFGKKKPKPPKAKKAKPAPIDYTPRERHRWFG